MNKNTCVIIHFFLLVFVGAFPLENVLAIDEVVDNYTDESKIAGKHNIVRNRTFNAMELGWGLIKKKKKTELGYYKDGQFYTSDFLNGIDYLAIVLLLNTTIPKKDSIIVEFSQDNSTWVNNNKLISGFQAIDLRSLNFTTIYFRFKFRDGGKEDSTPRLYQLRLVHDGTGMIGPDTPDGQVELDYTPYMALSIILLMFGLVIGSRLKR